MAQGGRPGDTGFRPLRSVAAVARWPVWELPGGLAAAVLTVEVVAVALMALGVAGADLGSDERWFLGAITLLGILHTEVGRGLERVRRRIGDEMLHVNMGSVWFFAGVVLLPPAWAAVSAVVVHVHIWLRHARPRSPLYREVFNSATTALSCLAAGAVMEMIADDTVTGAGDVFGFLALVLGVLVYITVNTALVGGAIAVSSPRAGAGDIVGDWQENLLEVATLCMGALTAMVLLINPWLVVFILPALLVLHRAVLVRHLEEAASRDGKTGLLNAAAWHNLAEQELRRAERREGARGVLVIDLDHFKSINDTYGHLAGDKVLAAVADALRGEVRDRDLVGRFGGEEFVVLLGGIGEGAGDATGSAARMEAVAERIRSRIATLRVEMLTPDGPLTVVGPTASVGGALYPSDGRDLHGLLHVADTALYAAKRAGRNAVRTGRHELPPVPSTPGNPVAQPAGERPSADR